MKSPESQITELLREIEPGEGAEKFPVPEELKQRITRFARRLQDKLMAGKNLTQADLAPIARFKLEVEMTPLRRDIEKQYPACLETLDFFELTDAPPPAIEKVMATFSPEMLCVARGFEQPILLLVPECSFERKIKALNEHITIPSLEDCYIADIYTETNPQNTITGYRALIVDGAAEMPKDKLKKGDDLKMTFAQRIEARKRNRRPHEKGMDRHSYTLLMMRSLKDKICINRIDRWGWEKCNGTLLDDDPANSDSHVPDACWNEHYVQVAFSCSKPRVVDDRIRFRSSVGGNILL